MIDRRNMGALTKTDFLKLIDQIRLVHGCPDTPMGLTNRERSNERWVTTLSAWVRAAENVRSIDIDQLVYCPRCLSPLIWIEVKPVNKAESWSIMRHLARLHSCYAMLVVEPRREIDNFDAVMLYVPEWLAQPC